MKKMIFFRQKRSNLPQLVIGAVGLSLLAAGMGVFKALQSQKQGQDKTKAKDRADDKETLHLPFWLQASFKGAGAKLEEAESALKKNLAKTAQIGSEMFKSNGANESEHIEEETDEPQDLNKGPEVHASANTGPNNNHQQVNKAMLQPHAQGKDNHHMHRRLGS